MPRMPVRLIAAAASIAGLLGTACGASAPATSSDPVDAAIAAWSAARSYHVKATFGAGTPEESILEVWVIAHGPVEFSDSTSAYSVRTRIVAGREYVLADAEYYRRTGTGAALLAGKWVLRPGDISARLAPYFDDPAAAARCILGGRHFVATGNAPDGNRTYETHSSTAPSFRLELSAGATPLPLRITETAPNPNRDTPTCMGAFGFVDDNSSPPVVTFDSFGTVPPIAAPAGYVDETGPHS